MTSGRWTTQRPWLTALAVLNQILTFSRVERGVLAYNFEHGDLAPVVAGIAYAGSRGSHDVSAGVSPVTTAPALAGPSFGSHRGRSAPGPTASTVPPTASHRPSGSGASAHGGAGASPGIRGGGGGGSAKPADDPHDRDQGTGDDGSHNDHGSGNNGPEGSPPPESHGR